jgi:hypothetical protein
MRGFRTFTRLSRHARLLLTLSVLLLCGLLTLPEVDAAESTNAPMKARAVLAQLFARPVTLQGTLNGAPIRMELHLKPQETEALEGSYSTTDQGARVLLAGEFEEDALMMEESVNGHDVSGLWDGVYDGLTLTGNWSSVDGSVSRPFILRITGAGAATPR